MRRVDICEATGCDDWQGWVIDAAGILWPSDTWRRGFNPFQLRALFFQCQQVRSLESDLRHARAELEHEREKNAALEKRTAFYRRQCQLESALGLALARIAG